MKIKRSTNNFVTGRFSTHGRLDTILEDGIFISHSTGPFNIEWVTALDKLRRACLTDVTPTYKSASITIFHNSMLMSKEALDVYSKNLKQHLSEIQISPIIAYVTPPGVEGKSIMLPFFERLFLENNVYWRAFENLDDAKVWVRSMLDEFINA